MSEWLTTEEAQEYLNLLVDYYSAEQEFNQIRTPTWGELGLRDEPDEDPDEPTDDNAPRYVWEARRDSALQFIRVIKERDAFERKHAGKYMEVGDKYYLKFEEQE